MKERLVKAGELVGVGVLVAYGAAYDFLHPPVLEAATPLRDCITGFEGRFPEGAGSVVVSMEDATTGELLERKTVVSGEKVVFSAPTNATKDGRRAFRGRIFNARRPEVKLDTLAACAEPGKAGEAAVVRFDRQVDTQVPRNQIPSTSAIDINASRVDVTTPNVNISGPLTGTTSPGEVAVGSSDSAENFRRWWWLPVSILGAGLIAGALSGVRGDGHYHDHPDRGTPRERPIEPAPRTPLPPPRPRAWWRPPWRRGPKPLVEEKVEVVKKPRFEDDPEKLRHELLEANIERASLKKEVTGLKRQLATATKDSGVGDVKVEVKQSGRKRV